MDYTKCRVPELKSLLLKKGLPTAGNKTELILRLREASTVHDDISPSDSVSCVSQVSRTSSVRSTRAKAAAKRAALETKLKSVEKKHSLEQYELKLKQLELENRSTLERLELETEIQASIAEEEVLSNYEENASRASSHSGKNQTALRGLPSSSIVRSSRPDAHSQGVEGNPPVLIPHSPPPLQLQGSFVVHTPRIHRTITPVMRGRVPQTPPAATASAPPAPTTFSAALSGLSAAVSAPSATTSAPPYPLNTRHVMLPNALPGFETHPPTSMAAPRSSTPYCPDYGLSQPPITINAPAVAASMNNATTNANHPAPSLGQSLPTDYAALGATYQPRVSEQCAQPVTPHLLAAISETVNLPKPELMNFDGKAKDYYKFIVNFETNLASRVTDSRLKLSYLIQLCSGEPKQLIEDCVLLEPDEGYVRACHLLGQRYGRAHIIARSHIDALTKGPPIKENDVQGLVKLSQDMQTCELTLTKLCYLADVNSMDTLRCIVARLPKIIRGKWVEKAAQILKTEEPKFSHLCQFIQDRADVASTMYGQEFAQDSKAKGPPQAKSGGKKFDKAPKVTTLVTKVEGAEGAKSTERVKGQWVESKGRNPKGKGKGCNCCGENHSLTNCPRFAGMTLEKRRDFIRNNKLCFNCLYYGHTARGCLKKSQCTKCRRKHHDLVHDDNFPQASRDADDMSDGHDLQETQPKQINESNVHCTNSHSQQIALRILPVCVESEGRTVKTYALLDCGSDVTLCDERLIHELRTKTTPISFNITTINQTSSVRHGSQVSLTVSSLDGSESISLDKVWSVKNLPVSLANLPNESVSEKWPHLAGISFPQIGADQVTLLIGSDVPEAFWTLEERRGGKKEPYAIRSPLGWTLMGPTGEVGIGTPQVHFQQTDVLGQQLEHMWKTDFSDSLSDNRCSMSVEDRQALQIMRETISKRDGKYMLSLPWRHSPEHFPNNKAQASVRLRLLGRKLQKDEMLCEQYKTTIQEYIDNGYARKVTPEELEQTSAWYLPHHPVVNPNKPGKVRIVFDCAAKYQGVSLNDQLLQGPDFMNSLVGVLLRFRQEPVAIVGDIEAMFHQVKVTDDDCKYLRFLWWENGDFSQPPIEYCMTVHLFGATSSPSCTAFCLKKTAEDNRNRFTPEAIETLERSFYVDDCLKSVGSTAEAISLVSDLRSLLRNGGFYLRKWVSNSREVLASIPDQEKSTSVANLTFEENLPFDKTLGLQWYIENDSFTFDIKEKSKPLTRRGLLSVTSSLFDPLGFVAPVTLSAKLILQNLCREGYQWDEPVPENEARRWAEWSESLHQLSNIQIARCIKPPQIDSDFTVELHHFADGSERAYGSASYVKIYDARGHVGVSLLMGKARLAPLKVISIPRLELSAAVVAVRTHQQIVREFDLKVNRSVFWTDSMSTLKCIRNVKTRFKTFVANRLAIIHDVTLPDDWKYVPSALNPADIASRGVQPNEWDKLQFWFDGPEFLKGSEDDFPAQPDLTPTFEEVETEVKSAFSVSSSQSQSDFMDRLINKHSSWFRLQKSVAWLLRFKQFCRSRYLNHDVSLETGRLSTQELVYARNVVLKQVQVSSFRADIERLSNASSAIPSKSSPLLKLCPILEDGLLKVGGRMRYAPLNYAAKHPVLLPEKHHVTSLIIRDFHQINGHVGSQHVLALIRSRYWIVHGMSAVKRVIGSCFDCRKRIQPPCKQQMAPLPEERLTPDNPPFTFVGVDFFGPMYVKHGRGQSKRYGCLFTCLTTRAVHIEIAHSLDTNSFLGALTRFISRRGKPSKVFSDNGTNLTSGEKELNSSISSWNQAQIHDNLLQQNIEWHFIPPLASHMGGVWERIVRCVKNVLKSLVKEQLLSDESLLTFVTEVERILNDRPITPLSTDVRDSEPLTPNKLLLLKSNASLPLGIFTKTESYYKRWWRQTQYLANVFWRRWLKEYLPTLQARDKWFKTHTNLKVGDIVLIVDEPNRRGQWPLGIVTGVNLSRDNLVRSIKVKCGSSIKVRPITKVCLLEGCS